MKTCWNCDDLVKTSDLVPGDLLLVDPRTNALSLVVAVTGPDSSHRGDRSRGTLAALRLLRVWHDSAPVLSTELVYLDQGEHVALCRAKDK